MQCCLCKCSCGLCRPGGGRAGKLKKVPDRSWLRRRGERGAFATNCSRNFGRRHGIVQKSYEDRRSEVSSVGGDNCTGSVQEAHSDEDANFSAAQIGFNTEIFDNWRVVSQPGRFQVMRPCCFLFGEKSWEQASAGC